MSFSWKELVCHGLMKEIGERDVVCHIMDFVKPLRRYFLEEEAREYRAKQYIDHVVIHPRCNIISSSPSLFKVRYSELREEYKDALSGRDPHCGAYFIRNYSSSSSVGSRGWKKSSLLWPSDIAGGVRLAGRHKKYPPYLDIVNRGRERRANRRWRRGGASPSAAELRSSLITPRLLVSNGASAPGGGSWVSESLSCFKI